MVIENGNCNLKFVNVIEKSLTGIGMCETDYIVCVHCEVIACSCDHMISICKGS